ncbi:hypothetical protein MTR67_049175 [Solanum verrucosum]|uniref:Uncharacterized protein n=1 Tax=Solanum verrucosum TaxID=315347 RepID=A0AAF1A0B8_SOLVR|nr:hypothetical protein MTR67_049175 [Solanum verrucosum]
MTQEENQQGDDSIRPIASLEIVVRKENCLSINAVPSLRYQAIFETSIEVLEQGSKRRKLWFSSQSLSFAKNFVLPGMAVIAREHQHPITKSRKEQRGASINWVTSLSHLWRFRISVISISY